MKRYKQDSSGDEATRISGLEHGKKRVKPTAPDSPPMASKSVAQSPQTRLLYSWFPNESCPQEVLDLDPSSSSELEFMIVEQDDKSQRQLLRGTCPFTSKQLDTILSSYDTRSYGDSPLSKSHVDVFRDWLFTIPLFNTFTRAELQQFTPNIDFWSQIGRLLAFLVADVDHVGSFRHADDLGVIINIAIIFVQVDLSSDDAHNPRRDSAQPLRLDNNLTCPWFLSALWCRLSYKSSAFLNHQDYTCDQVIRDQKLTAILLDETARNSIMHLITALVTSLRSNRMLCNTLCELLQVFTAMLEGLGKADDLSGLIESSVLSILDTIMIVIREQLLPYICSDEMLKIRVEDRSNLLDSLRIIIDRSCLLLSDFESEWLQKLEIKRVDDIGSGTLSTPIGSRHFERLTRLLVLLESTSVRNDKITCSKTISSGWYLCLACRLLESNGYHERLLAIAMWNRLSIQSSKHDKQFDHASIVKICVDTGLFELLFNRKMGASVLVEAIPAIRFISTLNYFTNHELDTLWSLVQSKPQTNINIAAVELIRQLAKFGFDNDQVLYLLSKMSTADFSWPLIADQIFTLVEALFTQGNWVEDMATRSKTLYLLVDMWDSINSSIDIQAHRQFTNALIIIVKSMSEANILDDLLNKCMVNIRSHLAKARSSAEIMTIIMETAPDKMLNIISPYSITHDIYLSTAKIDFVHGWMTFISKLKLILKLITCSKTALSDIEITEFSQNMVDNGAFNRESRSEALEIVIHHADLCPEIRRMLLRSMNLKHLLILQNKNARALNALIRFLSIPKTDAPFQTITKFMNGCIGVLLSEHDAQAADMILHTIFMTFLHPASRILSLDKIDTLLVVAAEEAMNAILDDQQLALSILTALHRHGGVMLRAHKYNRRTEVITRTYNTPYQDVLEVDLDIHHKGSFLRNESWKLSADCTTQNLCSLISKKLCHKNSTVFIGGKAYTADSTDGTTLERQTVIRNALHVVVNLSCCIESCDLAYNTTTAVGKAVEVNIVRLMSLLQQDAPMSKAICELLCFTNFSTKSGPDKMGWASTVLKSDKYNYACKIYALNIFKDRLRCLDRGECLASSDLSEGLQVLIIAILESTYECLQYLENLLGTMRLYLLALSFELSDDKIVKDVALYMSGLVKVCNVLADKFCTTIATDHSALFELDRCYRKACQIVLESAIVVPEIMEVFRDDQEMMSGFFSLLTNGNVHVRQILMEACVNFCRNVPDPALEQIICGNHPLSVPLEALLISKAVKMAMFTAVFAILTKGMDGTYDNSEILVVMRHALSSSYSWVLVDEGFFQKVWILSTMILGRKTQAISRMVKLDENMDTDLMNISKIVEICQDYTILHGQKVTLSSQIVRTIQNMLLDTNCGWEETVNQRFEKTIIDNSTTRSVLFHILTLTLDDRHDARSLIGPMQKVLDDSVTDLDMSQHNQLSHLRRADRQLAGLENLSQTCYMNSLLQQLFMNISFRRFIMGLAIVDEKGQALLVAMQQLFSNLENSCQATFRPVQLATILGIDETQQEDVHLFMTTLMSSLEDVMPDEKAKLTLHQMFIGKSRSQTQGDCGHISESTDEYINLSLAVRGRRNLWESLEEYVQGFQLDDADRYRCSQCEADGQPCMVDAYRRTRLEHVPDNLILALKRFCYESGDGGAKINDVLDFPPVLDMNPYKIGSFDQDVQAQDATYVEDCFELVGVIIHQGSLTYGHYWSYVKDHTTFDRLPGKWYCVEDANTREVTLEEVLAAGRGSDARPTMSNNLFSGSENAYVLFYRRRGSAQPEVDAHIPEQASQLRDVVILENKRTQRLNHVSDKTCCNYILSLLNVKKAEACECDVCNIEYGESAMNLGLQYLQKVAFYSADTADAERICCRLGQLLMERDSLSDLVIDVLVNIEPTAQPIFLFGPQNSSRVAASGLVLKALDKECFRDLSVHNDRKNYQQSRGFSTKSTVELVVELLEHSFHYLDDSVSAWSNFFRFAHRFCELGQVEFTAIGRSSLLKDCLQLLYVSYLTSSSERFPNIAKRLSKIPWQPLIDFLKYLLMDVISTMVESSNRLYRIPGKTLISEAAMKFLSRAIFVKSIVSRYPLSDDLHLNDCADWPPSQLLLQLCTDEHHESVKVNIISGLCEHFATALDSDHFRQAALPAISICKSSLIHESIRTDLLQAILTTSGLSYEEVSIAAIHSIKALLSTRVDESIRDNIVDWLCYILMHKVDNVRTKALSFFNRQSFETRHIVFEGPGRDQHTLEAHLQCNQVLFKLIELIKAGIMSDGNSRWKDRRYESALVGLKAWSILNSRYSRYMLSDRDYVVLNEQRVRALPIVERHRVRNIFQSLQNLEGWIDVLQKMHDEYKIVKDTSLIRRTKSRMKNVYGKNIFFGIDHNDDDEVETDEDSEGGDEEEEPKADLNGMVQFISDESEYDTEEDKRCRLAQNAMTILNPKSAEKVVKEDEDDDVDDSNGGVQISIQNNADSENNEESDETYQDDYTDDNDDEDDDDDDDDDEDDGKKEKECNDMIVVNADEKQKNNVECGAEREFSSDTQSQHEVDGK